MTTTRVGLPLTQAELTIYQQLKQAEQTWWREAATLRGVPDNTPLFLTEKDERVYLATRSESDADVCEEECPDSDEGQDSVLGSEDTGTDDPVDEGEGGVEDPCSTLR